MDMINCNTSAVVTRLRAGIGSAVLAAAFGLLASLSFITPSHALTLAKQVPDMVAEADWIVAADLVKAQSRWNQRRTLIVTDYHFRTNRVLGGFPSGHEFTLTQGGGTLGALTDELSDTPVLEVGNTYLMFVSPQRGEMFPPFIGGAQGVFLLQGDGTARSLGGPVRMEQSALMAQVEELVALRGTAAPQAQPDDYVPETPYPSKEYLPLALTPPSSGLALPPSGDDAADRDSDDGSSADLFVDNGMQSGGDVAPTYDVSRKIAPPAKFNQLVSSMAPWSPVDENMMWEWNRYGGDIFRIFTTPSPTWAFGNNQFDIAGFVSNAQMIAQFGWAWASNTLAVTVSRFTGNTIIEADIALNPAFCWTVDEKRAQNPADDCAGFRQVMLHELGHAWGLGHPWEVQDVWWDSVMNSFGKPYNTPQLRADDANALTVFGTRPARHDAKISLYTTQSRGIGTSPLYQPTPNGLKNLRHGDNLSAGNKAFTIENLGTDVVASPGVNFYLVPTLLSWSGRHLMGAASYASVPVYNVKHYVMPSLPLPSSLPTGEYHLAAQLRDSDYNAANNSAWATQLVRVKNIPPLLVPKLAVQLTPTGRIGPKGVWDFEFNAVAGVSYRFSLCPADGATAPFDTTLSIYDGTTRVAHNDDACGLQSALTFKAGASRRYKVVVGSWNNASQGNFRMAYSRLIDDVIFRHGFELIQL